MARGTAFVNPALKPGATALVANAGPASGSYLISRVEHIFSPGGFFTRFTAGGQRRTGLAEALAPAQARTAWSIAGLVIGLVTNITDDDGLGRLGAGARGRSGQQSRHRLGSRGQRRGAGRLRAR